MSFPYELNFTISLLINSLFKGASLISLIPTADNLISQLWERHNTFSPEEYNQYNLVSDNLSSATYYITKLTEEELNNPSSRKTVIKKLIRAKSHIPTF